ncbi:hypothetical protein FHS17_004365 [Paenibacillus lupini]|nr:hypothetical protein [Paenibacillus lupini]
MIRTVGAVSVLCPFLFRLSLVAGDGMDGDGWGGMALVRRGISYGRCCPSFALNWFT